jgi:sugar lactone lactonase YvrE
MRDICVPVLQGLRRVQPAGQTGADTLRSVHASACGIRRWQGRSLVYMDRLQRRVFPLRRAVLFKTALLCFLMVAATSLSWANPSYHILYEGLITTLATGTLGSNPFGLAVDLSGNVYIADTSNNRVVKVGSSGAASVLSITGLTLSAPLGLATNSAGNLFIADSGNNRIVEVTSAGSFSVVSTGSYTLNGPEGVAVDNSGNTFISDTNNSRIIEVASGGTPSVLSTTSGLSLSSVPDFSPLGLAVDAYGNLYIANFGNGANGSVIKVTTAGVGSTVTVNTSPALAGPSGVYVTRNGVIYIVDNNSAPARVVIVDPAGNATNLSAELGGLVTFTNPTSVAVDPNGVTYVVDNGRTGSTSGRVQSIQATTTDFGHVSLGSSTSLTLPFSVGPNDTLTALNAYTSGTQNLDFTIAGNSTCMVGTAGNGTTATSCNLDVTFSPAAAGLRKGAIVLTTSSGNITLPVLGYADAPVAALSPGVASPIAHAGTTIPIQGPFQTAVDGAGDIYVTGYEDSVVSKISSGGGTPATVSTAPYTLSSPTGIALDAANNLFISDYMNNRIIEVNSNGTASPLTINGLPSTTVGGVTSIIHAPTALAFDAVGNLYITDYGSGRIIEVTPSLAYFGGISGDGTVANGNGYVIATPGITFGQVNITGSTVDGSGNIFIPNRDASPPVIVKVDPLGTTSTVSLGSVGTLNSPYGITTDPLGDLYIMDSGHERIVQVTANGDASVMQFSGASLSIDIFGLTADSNGNVLVSDFINNRLVDVNVGQAALTFPNTNVFASSTVPAPSPATVTNIGNQPLVFSANPTYTSNFSENTMDANPCTSSTMLTMDSSCDVPIIFTPQSVGSLSANVTVTDNNLSVPGSTQQIAASGTGTGAPTTTTVTFSPPSPVYGQSLTVTATVSAAGTPTGTVAFTDLTTSTTLAAGVNLTSGIAYYSTTALAVGSHVIKAVYTPTGGFITSSGTNTVTINQASTATALMLSGSTLTAAVTAIAPGAGTPTGSVQFLNGSTVVGNGTLSAGTATTTVTVPSAYSFTAAYAGDLNFRGSTSSAVTRTSISTTTTVSFLPPSPVYGQSVTLTATVSATGSTPTGTVSFTDQSTSTTLASGVNLSSGVATVTLSTLGVGSHVIQAVYTPTGSLLTSNASNTVTIAKASTGTALLLSGSTLTATVTAVAPGAGNPTGSVQFLTSNTVLGTGTLSGGTATWTVAVTASNSFTAVYSGDANFLGSTSQALVPYPPVVSSLMLTGSPNPAQLGQPVKFTAVIQTGGGLPSSATPTGSVQFYDGTRVLGSSGVSNRQATYTATALAGGTHTITAVYSGDATFPPASAALALIVSAPITMNVTAAPPAAVYGQPITLTVTVGATSVPAGLSPPTGQVTVLLEASTPFSPNTKLGTVNLASGIATLNLNSLPTGALYIDAQYSGDSTWPATARQLPLIISPAASATSLSVTVTSGQLLLIATVVPQPPGAGTPTGNVQFVDTSSQNAVVASANLSGGTATAQIATNTLAAVGGHPIEAIYSGDGNFIPSTSAPLPAIASSAANVTHAVAPDEIASLFGVPGLNGAITATLPLGTSLGGVSVNIIDSTAATYPALLYGVYASSGQINLVIPSGTAAGPAVGSITLPGGAVVTTALDIVTTAPAVYTVNYTGHGTYSGQVTYVHADGTQTVVPSATYNAGSNSFTPIPVNLGTPGDQVFLVLYGTGLRHASSVSATVNGTPVPVASFGAQPVDPGLDQINLGPLPSSLAGAGEVSIIVTVDGQPANAVTVTIQ